MLRKIKQWMDKTIDYKAAFAASFLLGIIVFGINMSHGIPIALVAAGKQATYTFFVAGFITRFNQTLALRFDSPFLSVVFAASIASCFAVGLTFLVHSLKGTPEPIYSTLPTLLLAVPGFFILGWRARYVVSEENMSS